MINYNEFMRRYSSKLVSTFNQNDFEMLKAYVSGRVRETISFYGFNYMNVNKCVEGVMLYLLSQASISDIIVDGYEEQIETAVFKMKERFYDKTVSKSENKFKEIKSKPTAKKSLDPAREHIKEVIGEIDSIFANGTDFEELSNEIYDMMIYDGISPSDIASDKSNHKILECVRNVERYGKVSFNPDFLLMRKKTTSVTASEFAKNEKSFFSHNNKLSRPMEYNVYSNNTYMNQVAFRAAVALKMMGYSHENIDYNKLNNFIENDTTRIMIENNSVISESKKVDIMRKANFKEAYQKEIKDIAHNKEKKKKIVIGVVIAVFILENLGYKIADTIKKEAQEDHRPKYSYSSEYNSSSSYNSESNTVSIAEYYSQRHK